MGLTCDECGKPARLDGKPDETHWLEWVGNDAHGDDKMLIAATMDDLTVHAVCRACIGKWAVELNEIMTPNA